MVAGSSPAGCAIGGSGTVVVMVGVAQSVEHRIVTPGVEGSIPFVHPIHLKRQTQGSGVFFKALHADVVELVDTLDLGSSAARRESSSLSVRTIFSCSLLYYAACFCRVTSVISPSRMCALDSGARTAAYVCAMRKVHASFC